MDVEHDENRTASLVLQEIERDDAGGEYIVSPSERDVQFAINIQEQVKNAQAPQVAEMEMLQDPVTETVLEEGESATAALKKALEGRVYRPEIPAGHRLNIRQDERVKFNKSRLKEYEETLTSDPTPLRICRGADITNLQEQEAEIPNAENLRSKDPESSPAQEKSTTSHQGECNEDLPGSNRRPARYKPTKKYLEYIADQDPE